MIKCNACLYRNSCVGMSIHTSSSRSTKQIKLVYRNEVVVPYFKIDRHITESYGPKTWLLQEIYWTIIAIYDGDRLCIFKARTILKRQDR